MSKQETQNTVDQSEWPFAIPGLPADWAEGRNPTEEDFQRQYAYQGGFVDGLKLAKEAVEYAATKKCGISEAVWAVQELHRTGVLFHNDKDNLSFNFTAAVMGYFSGSVAMRRGEKINQYCDECLL